MTSRPFILGFSCALALGSIIFGVNAMLLGTRAFSTPSTTPSSSLPPPTTVYTTPIKSLPTFTPLQKNHPLVFSPWQPFRLSSLDCKKCMSNMRGNNVRPVSVRIFPMKTIPENALGRKYLWTSPIPLFRTGGKTRRTILHSVTVRLPYCPSLSLQQEFLK
jgi:hypothetical protein